MREPGTHGGGLPSAQDGPAVPALLSARCLALPLPSPLLEESLAAGLGHRIRIFLKTWMPVHTEGTQAVRRYSGDAESVLMSLAQQAQAGHCMPG